VYPGKDQHDLKTDEQHTGNVPHPTIRQKAEPRYDKLAS
jgi:hypothetical protein